LFFSVFPGCVPIEELVDLARRLATMGTSAAESFVTSGTVRARRQREIILSGAEGMVTSGHAIFFGGTRSVIRGEFSLGGNL